jgi:transcription-repair coupling factor (superfamily II helicase)
MRIEGLLAYSEQVTGYRQLLSSPGSAAWVLETARPYLLAAFFRDLKHPMLVLAARPDSARNLAEQLAVWLPETTVRLLPEPAALPYQAMLPDSAGEIETIQCLSAMLNSAATSLVVASVPALLQKRPAAEVFRGAAFSLKPGMKIEPLKLMGKLVDLGYEQNPLVELPGQTGRRGGIVDVYPPTSMRPVRLEYFGNTIETLRYFDTGTQKSLEGVDEVSIGPASVLAPVFSAAKAEAVSPASDRTSPEEQTSGLAERYLYAPLYNYDYLISYLSSDGCLVVEDRQDMRHEAEFLDTEASRILTDKTQQNSLTEAPPRPYFKWEEISAVTAERAWLEMVNWKAAGESGVIKLGFEPIPEGKTGVGRWIKSIQGGPRTAWAAVSQQAPRLYEMLEKATTAVQFREEILTKPVPGSISVVQGILAGGWCIADALCLITDKELFGFTKIRRAQRRRPLAKRSQLFNLKPGDYVVHVEHGIGRYKGITTLSSSGQSREYLLVQYAGDDRLYVPTDQIDRLERYIGASDTHPTLNRMGSVDWIRSKDRARQAAEDIARELLELYAYREIQPGFAYSEDSLWQMEMESAFPFVETPDQLTAIAEVKEDMGRPKPMDRLICGDVGYGKTEVALRAAFKAVMDGKQVAVLVPTTVLAQQHFQTFNERLGLFPVKVDLISRFRSGGEQKEALKGLADGTVDIVIGTHRLLQKDVAFKDLGLLVIDEEQRFGVKHKEHLKKMRQEVDVLTLSATPIPRTLHMSLAGVRDMSIIETPPEERLPIRTLVAEYNETLIREAIIREMERNGQVYLVHNRVQSIMTIADKIRRLVPEAVIGIGHGQMPEESLEKVMSEFVAGKLDVLVCTTIIESGLDVPNANTLIINQADKLGLTQLYQLRGRVGRAANLAYAYFLYDKGKNLKPDADKRLRTIYEATELGAGFSLAMKDLEIRGAGNILGARQSGHINAVGFSFYTQVLSEAVEDLKSRRDALSAGKPFTPRLRLPLPSIDLPLTAYIPESYIQDTDSRLGMYQRMAICRREDEVEELQADMRDRFGQPPPEVTELIYVMRVRVLAVQAGVVSVTREGESIVLRRSPGIPFDLNNPLKNRRGVRISYFQARLDVSAPGVNWQDNLMEMLRSIAPPGEY